MGLDAASEEQFGPYLVYERLGVGGMATVHRALERGIEGFERIVALKRLLPHLAEDGSFIKSFVREAKLASLLNHVNIVQIFELGRVGTEYFISMEYIDGRDIRRILRHARKVTGPPPIHVTVGLLLQLCEALDYAHARVDDQGHPLKLVHRDISPSNLLVTSAGHLKIIDFGIAKAQSSQLRTQTGRVKGKLAYMAPEAIAGKELDARSDLFAAGVIAHELLTARPLFASKNEYQTLIKVQRGDITPPSAFNQAVPKELDAIVLEALARDPESRFATAGEMRDSLLELRRTMNLQTGHRDVAAWLSWAFSLEAPTTGFGGLTDPAGTSNVVSVEHDLALGSAIGGNSKARREDDEAVEVAWGGGDAEHARPIVLDDVPDVSEKFAAASQGIAARLELDDLDDDIPAHQPSHGHLSKSRAAKSSRSLTEIPQAHDPSRDSDPAPLPPPPPARPSMPPTPMGTGSPHLPATSRGTGSNPIVGRAPTARDGSLLPRSSPSAPPPPLGQRRTTAPGAAVVPPTTRSGATPLPGAPLQRDPNDTSGTERQSDPGTSTPRAARSPTDLSAMLRPTPSPEVAGEPPRTPSVRFRETVVEPAEIPRLPPGLTKPGIGARPVTIDPLTESQATETQPRPRRASTSTITIGSAIVARQSVRRTWPIIVGLAAITIGGAGFAIYVTRGSSSTSPQTKDETPKPPAKPGTLKFVTEPTDAEIVIEGKPGHTGSPWSIELEPGAYSITIQRTGYKARLMSVELSSTETLTYIVPLEKLAGGSAAVAEANLLLSSTPLGLEALIDGKVLAMKTPFKMSIAPGQHLIVLRQNGVDVWKQKIDAKPSTEYAFAPSMSEEKLRERKQRQVASSETKLPIERQPHPDDKVEEPKPLQPPPVPPIDKTTEKGPGTNNTTAHNGTVTPPTPGKPGGATDPVVPPPVIPEPPAPPQVPTITHPTGPVFLAPGNVPQRTGGETPSVTKSRQGEVPPSISAKLCIDTGGTVTSVQIYTKGLEERTRMDLMAALKSWRYQAYKTNDGVLATACFVISFRVK